ncbi:hypothetical protein DOY81_013391, partial [Sarcophaga bullata]
FYTLSTNLILPRVKRQHMGAYLCIASNGVPPSVSKRITLIVHFPPMITVQNQLIGAVEGKGGKFVSNVTEIGEYRSSMKLHINPLTMSEFGAYRCVAKNSLGDTDGTIKLYRIPSSTVNYVDGYDSRYKDLLMISEFEDYYPNSSTTNPMASYTSLTGFSIAVILFNWCQRH